MKRIISSLILICVLAGSLIATASCGKKIDSGTEAAKLLLANERLDEKVLSTEDSFNFAAEKTEGVKALASSAYHSPSISDSFSVDPSLDYVDKTERHSWSDFPAYSRSEIEFSQFVNSVEHEVSYVAEDIANMKNNVGITDKWVAVDGEMHMLRVFDTYDVLFVLGVYEDVHVYYRYTDENAKNVYEMYSFMKYDDGTTGDIRTLCIPGERYEYMYENSGGFTDYFIAESSKGFWINTRFYFTEVPENDSIHSYYSTYIVRDGIGIGISMDFDNGVLRTPGFFIFDPVAKREIAYVSFSDDGYNLGIALSNIKEGLASVSADNVTYDDEDGIYTSNQINRFVTSVGTYTASRNEQSEPGFHFSEGYVGYDYMHKVYDGMLYFFDAKPSGPIEEALIRFEDLLGSMGLKLHVSMREVANVFEHAILHCDTFADNFFWNGYNAKDPTNIKKSHAVLLEDYASAKADYEKIKDNEVATEAQLLSGGAEFASLSIVAGGSNSYSGGKITLDGITVSVNDVRLFETGLDYVLKVAISRLDESGNPISVNTLPLSGGAETPITFSGNSITLFASGEFAVPKNMASGSYAAVVYVATEDEGIRVSKMQKISFITVDGGKIDSSAMDIEAIGNGNDLTVKYDIKNKRYITVTLEGGSLSFDQVQRLLLTEILAYGAPMHNATVENESGEPMDISDVFGRGAYRMKCYLNTSDGLAESYVYLTVE